MYPEVVGDLGYSETDKQRIVGDIKTMHQASYRATKGICEIVDARPPAPFNNGSMKGSKNVAFT